MRYLALVLVGLLVACSDDDNPTSSAPGSELVGTWVGISTTDPTEEPFAGVIWVIRADGTGRQSLSIQGLEISVEMTWESVAGKLVSAVSIGGETQVISEAYTVRDDRLTLVDDTNGTVEIWERQ
jgi:hypothetical protein